MKDVNILSLKNEKANRAELIFAALYHLAAAAVGFFLCRAVFFENYLPFGVAFMSGCPAALLPSAAVGVFLGYFLPGISVFGFKYVAAALAVLAVRFMLSFNKKLIANPLFAGLISALAVGFAGSVSHFGAKNNFLLFALEVLACGIGAVIINRASIALSHIERGLSSEDLGCLLILIGMALSGLFGFSFFGLKISLVLACFLFLSAAKYGGAAAGMSSAVAVSLLFFFAGKSAEDCFVYTVAAFSAGIVCAYGKYVQLCAFFVCVVFFLSLRGITRDSAIFITEAALGCLLFAFMPKSAGIKLAKIFTCFPKICVNNDLNRAVTLRLKEAAQGIKDVKATVDDVAARLEGINAPSFSSVLATVENEACGGCKMRANCWEAKRDLTLDAVFTIIKEVKSGAREYGSACDFKSRCLRFENFAKASKKGYLEYAGKVAGNSRITDIRQAVGEQFEGIAIMLEELSNEYMTGVNFDNSAALTAVGTLKNIGIYANECSAPIDKYGRMEINLKLGKGSEAVLNKRDIMRVLSLSCERNFAPPVIKNTSGETFITVGERAEFGLDIGVFQKSAKPGDLCGDAYSYFFDGKGHFIMLLSDGMGTGSRAAVDSAMASGLMTRLIKSGFGFNCALKILNSSMLFRSADESLATMDVACLDLHTGALELFKAGAAPTLVKRGGKVGKAVSTSMPIGILSSVSFDRAGVKLTAGDITVLLSDGAAPDDVDRLKEEILSFKDGSAQSLAERLVSVAESRRSDGHTDDITVMVAILKKQ